MLNKVQIIGRLGRDPDLKYTQSGSPVCSLSVATDESYTDRDGNKVDRTEWHKVSVFQRAAEACANHLGKGSLVYVEGSLATRKWQDQSGQDRFTTEIKAQRVQFLDRRNVADGDTADDTSGSASQRHPPHGRGTGGRPQDGSRQSDGYGPAFPSETAAMDEVPF